MIKFLGRRVYFAKVKEDAIIPNKRKEDAGFDIYACLDTPYLVIQPHETIMIPTGIASAFSSKYVAILKERGSTGTKGMGQRSGVIDSGYRGEWLVPITNHNTKPIIMYKDKQSLELIKKEYSDFIAYPMTKAICQAVIQPIPRIKTYEISYDELKEIESERGIGKLGSSGK